MAHFADDFRKMNSLQFHVIGLVMLLLFLPIAAHAADPCKTISASDILSIPEPAVIVLGERFGSRVELARASRVIKGLAKKSTGGVTLATERVHYDHQKAFDQFSTNGFSTSTLEQDLNWGAETPVSFKPYGRLFKQAAVHANLIAAGPNMTAPTNDVQPPVPAVYPALVSSVVAQDQLTFGMDNRISRILAYWDYQVAMRALHQWDGKGYLVIMTERARSEGGGGVPWQVSHEGSHTAYSFLLSWANSYCEEGDNVWAKVPLLHTMGL